MHTDSIIFCSRVPRWKSFLTSIKSKRGEDFPGPPLTLTCFKQNNYNLKVIINYSKMFMNNCSIFVTNGCLLANGLLVIAYCLLHVICYLADCLLPACLPFFCLAAWPPVGLLPIACLLLVCQSTRQPA